MVDQTHGKVTLHRQRRQNGKGGGRGCVCGNMSGCVGMGVFPVNICSIIAKLTAQKGVWGGDVRIRS